MIEYSFILIFAAIMGSVANMLIFRLPRNLNIVSDRSKCTSCQHKLGVFDLVPILSFILLKGRCYHCRSKIPLRYLIVECLSVLIFLYVFSTLGLTLSAFKLLLFSYATLILFFTDLETQLLPFKLNILLLGIGLLFGLKQDFLVDSFVGMLVGAVILLILRFVTSKIYKMETLGLGDVILLASIGAFWGMKAMLVSVHAGVIVGGVYALLLLALNKAKKTDVLAFGPFLIVGFWINHFFGEQLVNWIYG